MPVTLEQAKVGMTDKVDQFVVDEFRRGSLLMDRLIYDDAVSPGTGGSTLVYGYTQLLTPATAQMRAINTEYVPNEAAKVLKTAALKILGGSFQVDRVIENTSGRISETTFQLEQKIKAAYNLFHYLVINGDSAVNPLEFDGLDKMLTGTATELGTGSVLNLTAMTDQASAFALLDAVDDFLGSLSGKPTMLLGNSKLIQKIKSAARWAGYYTRSENAFGDTIDGYGGIPLVDLEYFAKVDADTQAVTTEPIVAIEDRTVGTAQTGLTDLYAVRVGLDGFHGVTPLGGNGVGLKTYLPDFGAPGAVKTGEVEMVVAAVLKQTRAAGVLRNIKVQ